MTAHILIAGDSRSWGFDKRNFDIDFHVTTHFVIKRGATCNKLLEEIQHSFHREEFPLGADLIAKIAVGINDIISKNEEGELIHKGTEGVIEKLENIKSFIRSIHNNAIVSFCTIPPAAVQKDIHVHLDEVKALNNRIRELNFDWQGIYPHTPTWHAEVASTSKKRNSSGKLRICNDIRRTTLYDGLHAKSEIKGIWFQKLKQSVQYDLRELTMARNLRLA